MRQLPDGTWLDTNTNVALAPRTQNTGMPLRKLPAPAQNATLNGQGVGESDPGILGNMNPKLKVLIAVGAVIGVTALTVILSQKGAGRSVKKAKK